MKKDANYFTGMLESKGFKVELKGYKELPSHDGYFMTGSIYIDGKKVFNCEDGGYGGECEIDVESKNDELAKKVQKAFDEINIVLAKEQEKLVASLKNDENKDKDDFHILYDNDYSTYEYEIEVSKIFYELAENLMRIKDLKKHSKNKYMFSFQFKDENDVQSYKLYDKKYELKSVYKAILKIMEKDSVKEVLKFDETRMIWIKIDLEMMKKMAEA